MNNAGAGHASFAIGRRGKPARLDVEVADAGPQIVDLLWILTGRNVIPVAPLP